MYLANLTQYVYFYKLLIPAINIRLTILSTFKCMNEIFEI